MYCGGGATVSAQRFRSIGILGYFLIPCHDVVLCIFTYRHFFIYTYINCTGRVSRDFAFDPLDGNWQLYPPYVF